MNSKQAGLWTRLTGALARRTIKSPNKLVKWTFRAGVPAMELGGFGAAGYLGGQQKGLQNMANTGADVASDVLSKQIAGLPAWQRELVAFDPSLAISMADRANPGLISAYEQQTGNKFQPGLLGSIFHQDKPVEFVYDSPAGITKL